jgi:hypothetical protein
MIAERRGASGAIRRQRARGSSTHWRAGYELTDRGQTSTAINLFGDDLDTIADRLDARAQEVRGTQTSGLRADAEVIKLPRSESQPAHRRQ